MKVQGIVSLAAALLVATTAAAQDAPASTAPLPYAAVHDPEFLAAVDATFMHGEDRVIGIVSGKTPKAFPAGILSQHGLVEDRSPKGPIAVTW
jgi:Protein of unknown function (DUF3179)